LRVQRLTTWGGTRVTWAGAASDLRRGDPWPGAERPVTWPSAARLSSGMSGA